MSDCKLGRIYSQVMNMVKYELSTEAWEGHRKEKIFFSMSLPGFRTDRIFGLLIYFL